MPKKKAKNVSGSRIALVNIECECPYCGAENVYEEYDVGQDIHEEMDCYVCEKVFVISIRRELLDDEC